MPAGCADRDELRAIEQAAHQMNIGECGQCSVTIIGVPGDRSWLVVVPAVSRCLGSGLPALSDLGEHADGEEDRNRSHGSELRENSPPLVESWGCGHGRSASSYAAGDHQGDAHQHLHQDASHSTLGGDKGRSGDQLQEAHHDRGAAEKQRDRRSRRALDVPERHSTQEENERSQQCSGRLLEDRTKLRTPFRSR
jgi:hypothetical protein